MQLTDVIELLPPTPRSVKLYVRRYWTAKIGQAEATDDDKNTAIEKLRTLIKRAFDGDYSPHIITYRGYQGIAWRTPHNWTYKVLDPDGVQQCEGTLTRLWGCSSYDSEKEVQKHLRFHLAEIAWNGQEETSTIITDAQDQEQFGRNCRWQKRYKELAAAGNLDDTAIREQIMRENL